MACEYILIWRGDMGRLGKGSPQIPFKRFPEPDGIYVLVDRDTGTLSGLPDIQILNINFTVLGKVICFSPADTDLVMKSTGDARIKVHLKIDQYPFASPFPRDNAGKIDRVQIQRPVALFFFED